MLTLQTLFRGSSPGVEKGPYLSQFMLIGNIDINGGGSVADGRIMYGAVQVDRRVARQQDYRITFADWFGVQSGGDVRNNKALFEAGDDTDPQSGVRRRFITTPATSSCSPSSPSTAASAGSAVARPPIAEPVPAFDCPR